MAYTEELTDEQRQTLDTELTITDFTSALNQMNRNSSPGPDGLTTEFYQAFFSDLAPLFSAMVKETFLNEGLPESQKLSYISLIPKDSGSPSK